MLEWAGCFDKIPWLKGLYHALVSTLAEFLQSETLLNADNFTTGIIYFSRATSTGEVGRWDQHYARRREIKAHKRGVRAGFCRRAA